MVRIFESEEDLNGEPVSLYHLEEKGTQWLLQNEDKLVLRNETKLNSKVPRPAPRAARAPAPRIAESATFASTPFNDDDFDDSDPFEDE